MDKWFHTSKQTFPKGAWIAIASCLALCLSPADAFGEASLVDGLGGPAGFGTEIGRSDDGYYGPIDVSTAFPAGLRFFGVIHRELFINTNGNVSFSAPVEGYTPEPFPLSDAPVIAPFWADVDLDGGEVGDGGNMVYFFLDETDGSLIVTWYQVGYFEAHTDLLNSFQLILTGRGDVGPGDFDVEYRYSACQWTTGDASGGQGGLGGTAGQMGYDAGDQTNFWLHPDSLDVDILNLCSTSNVGQRGVWRFEVRSGAPAVCGDGIRSGDEGCDDGNVEGNDGCTDCVRYEDQDGDHFFSDVDCDDQREDVWPGAPERCDGLDNDCNLDVDEGFPNSDGDRRPDCTDTDDDNDGLEDTAETTAGTDPFDADSDDDGVLDGREPSWNIDTDEDGNINALDEDSDGDGIGDGTELGIVEAGPDTDLTAGRFIPDEDPQTTTDPLDRDTDGGGLDDGDEDRNSNGALEQGESDPTDPRDDLPATDEPTGGDGDADADTDGIADGGADSDVDGNAPDAESDIDEGLDEGPIIIGNYTGGAFTCQSTPRPALFKGPWILVLLLLCGLWLRRKPRSKTKAALLWPFVGAALLLCPTTAWSQDGDIGITLDRYRPSETPFDGMAISRPNDLGHLRVGASFHLDYARSPLLLELRSEGRLWREELVAHQLVGTFGLALGLADRLVISTALPVNLMMRSGTGGESLGTSGFLLGDIALGLRVRLVGGNDDLAALSLQGTVSFPTANAAQPDQAFTGDRGVTGQPELLFELRPGIVRIAANVGVRARKLRDYGGLVAHNELTYGLGLSVVPHRVVDVFSEVYGATAFSDFGDPSRTALEASFGLRVQAVEGLYLSLAGGPGLVWGVGSPRARAVFSVAYVTPQRQEPREPEPQPRPPTDIDGDGLIDDDDQCPQVAEDVDLFEDEDGCPEPDNDGDSLLDGEDRCPLEAEDRDQFEDDDGCPDLDNDGDTVVDAADRCPLEPGRPDNNGCPVVRIELDRIVILQRIEFELDSSRLRPESLPVLEEVLALLTAEEQISRVRIEGHTDDRGSASYNLELSRGRAQTVRQWLVDNGVHRSRLEATGLGESRPIESNESAQGRQTNRRVEFHIVGSASQ